MRRLAVLLGTLSLLLVGLTACGGDDAPTRTGDATVTGSFGTAPKVKTSTEFKRTKVETEVVTAGDGEVLASGDGVFANLLVVNGYDGENSIDTWETGNKEFLELTKDSLPGLTKALTGKKVGSRVVIQAPASEIFGEYGQPDFFISPKDSIVIVADLVSRTRKDVTSKPADEKPGNPKIVFKGTQPSSLDFSAAKKAPTKATLVTITEGNGPALTKDSTLVMRYLGQVWGGKKPFDENFTKQLQPKPVSEFVSGFSELLPGVKAGSRVLLILPPASGYGKKGNKDAGIKATDTIVFVVDVLGADEPTPAKEATGDKK